MKLGSMGSDLARMLTMQRQAASTRSSLDLAGVEATTGKKNDVYEASGGNLTRLFSLDRALERNAVFTDTISMSEMRLEVTQEALGRVFGPVESLSVDLLASVGLGDIGSGRMHADAARARLAETLGILNTRVAGQSLFAGTATGQNAVASSDAILADLDALAGAAVTAADAIAAIEDYFAPPAGAFYTDGYLGADADLSEVEIADGARLQIGVRADREEIVSVLRAQAMAAVVAGGAFAGDPDSQLRLLGAAGEGMLAAREEILSLRAEVGLVQNALETGKAERVAERGVLDLARTEMLQADQIEAATRFKNLEAQLQAIYTITARLSDLRFTNFIR